MKKINFILAGILLGITSLFWQVENVAAESIAMKILVVNPSKERAQTVPIKTYLPQEIKNEDVIDKAGLKLNYDVERKLYYLEKEIELPAAKSMVYEVELKDVWVFSEKEVDSLRKQAEKLVGKLAGTEYSAQASVLEQKIEKGIEEILRKQQEAKAIDVLPQRHIAVYRENVERFKVVKANLTALEKLVVRSGIRSGVKARLSAKTTYKIILAIIVFLGVLSLLFFTVWHIQAKQQKAEEAGRAVEQGEKETKNEGEDE